MSKSYELAKSFLGNIVKIKIDRPIGSKHPKWGYEYPYNYGYMEGVVAPDGKELDACVLKVKEKLDIFEGKVIAIIHRLNDDDDKLVVIPENETITKEEIEKEVEFQEKWFEHEIIF